MLGEIMLERGELDGARFWLDEKVLLAERLTDTVALIDGHLQLVAIECAAGRPDDADAHFRLASDLRRAEHRSGDLQFLEARAELALHSACPRAAIDLAEAALELANEIGSAPERCRSLRLLGDAQLAAGDPARAVATFQELIARADAASFPCRAGRGSRGRSRDGSCPWSTADSRPSPRRRHGRSGVKPARSACADRWSSPTSWAWLATCPAPLAGGRGFEPPASTYQFGWSSRTSAELGAFHAIDLPFTFDTFDVEG